MNLDIIKKVKDMERLLRNRNELLSELHPISQNNLTNIILELHGNNYKFKPKHCNDIFNQITYEDPNGNDNDVNNYLFRKYHPDHIKVIIILFESITLNFRQIRDLIEQSHINNNYYWLDLLLDINYKFTLSDIIIMSQIYKKGKSFYVNNKIENSISFENGTIMYTILKLISTDKISEEYFNKTINIINGLYQLDPQHFALAVHGLKCYTFTNKEKGYIFISTLFLSCIKNTQNKDTLFNIICKNGLKHNILCKLLVQHIYNDTLFEILYNKNKLHQNLELLFYMVQYHNFIVTENILNKFLLKTEMGKISIEMKDFKYLNNIIHNKKCTITSFNNILVNFNFDNGEFIEITNDTMICTGKINIVDLFDIFKIKPNNDTLSIIMERGYARSFDKLINEHNFQINEECLTQSIKSGKIDLIAKILQYSVKPTKFMLEMLCGPGTKNVFLPCNIKARFTHRRMQIEKNKTKYNMKIINIVELLIKHGLVIDLSCVSLLLSCDCVLTDLARFNIEYDENLYFECYINEYWPKEYMDKFTIDKNILNMRHLMFKGTTETIIIQFITTHNVKFDGYSLEFGLMNNNKFAKILMNKHNWSPSYPTLYKMSLCVRGLYSSYDFDNKLFRTFIDKNHVTKDVMMSHYNKIKLK